MPPLGFSCAWRTRGRACVVGTQLPAFLYTSRFPSHEALAGESFQGKRRPVLPWGLADGSRCCWSGGAGLCGFTAWTEAKVFGAAAPGPAGPAAPTARAWCVRACAAPQAERGAGPAVRRDPSTLLELVRVLGSRMAQVKPTRGALRRSPRSLTSPCMSPHTSPRASFPDRGPPIGSPPHPLNLGHVRCAQKLFRSLPASRRLEGTKKLCLATPSPGGTWRCPLGGARRAGTVGFESEPTTWS